MFRYAAVLFSMLVSPAWAGPDVATLNGVPVTALQTYFSFAEKMNTAGWSEVSALDCKASAPCFGKWQGPNGERLSVRVQYRNDANEFYVMPAVMAD